MNLPVKIFLVEDDPYYARLLHYHIGANPEHYIEVFETGSDLLNNLHRNPDIISLDYGLPDLSGMDVLKQIKDFNPDIPVIIVSGQGEIAIAVDLFKAGAYDYIIKGDNTKERLWNTIERIKEKIELKQEIIQLRSQISGKYNLDRIQGNSDEVKKMSLMIEIATKSNLPVVLTGETGCGKGLIAKSIHYNSSRAEEPFVIFPTSVFSESTIELELFGYEKDAMPGLPVRKIGKLEDAHKGTLYIEEICNLDSKSQLKLLNFLQEKEINRIGNKKLIKLDVRIIASTSKDINKEVLNGNLRKDLYYRIIGIPINVVPLRERGNDIIDLSYRFIEEFCIENNLKKAKLTPEAQSKLLNYTFPGNISELKSTIELAICISQNNTITGNDIVFKTQKFDAFFHLEEKTLEEYEQLIIKHFLSKNNNNVNIVAEKLNIAKSTIYRMIKNGKINIK